MSSGPRAVAQTPPPGAQALCRFDSRALSLLLKDLGKAGEGGRAAELFDRLRQLRGTDAGHMLAPLCDVYTYTAAIALCIHQQARDRAGRAGRTAFSACKALAGARHITAGEPHIHTGALNARAAAVTICAYPTRPRALVKQTDTERWRA